MSSLVFADPGNSQPRIHVQIDKEVTDFVCNFFVQCCCNEDLKCKLAAISVRFERDLSPRYRKVGNVIELGGDFGEIVANRGKHCSGIEPKFH